MAKEISIASFFGMSGDLDAYLLASLLPTYVINVAAGSIDASFIPVYIQVKEKDGAEAAHNLFVGILIVTAFSLAAIASLMGAMARPVLSAVYAGLPPARVDLMLNLFYLILPAIVLTGLCSVCEALLNAGGKFLRTGLTPCLVSVFVIAMLAIFGKSIGIYSIAAGTIGGLILQLCVLVWIIRSRHLKMILYPLKFHPAIKRVARQFVPTMAASAMMCSTVIVDQSMASALAPGSVAVLNFANKLVAFVLTLGTAALGTVILPYFSRLVAAADWDALSKTTMTYVKLILLTTIPVMLAGILFSDKLISLIFERGRFAAGDTMRVAWVQTMFFIQIPFYSVSILLVKLISSLEANKILFWGTAISVGLNVFLNAVLARRMGAAGIALSTSIVYAVSAAYLGIMAHRALKAKRA